MYLSIFWSESFFCQSHLSDAFVLLVKPHELPPPSPIHPPTRPPYTGHSPDTLAETLEPLFDTIVKEVAPPVVKPDAPLQMLVTNIDYDEHKGRIAIGRVTAGTIKKAQTVRRDCGKLVNQTGGEGGVDALVVHPSSWGWQTVPCSLLNIVCGSCRLLHCASPRELLCSIPVHSSGQGEHLYFSAF
jgi:hypothetical protein